MAVRGTLQGSKARKSSFGINEGTVRITGCRFKAVQHQTKDGTKITPQMVKQLDVVKLDDQLQETETTETRDLLISWGTKEADDQGRHRFYFYPATIESHVRII